ncbi:hypothetical protein D9M68_434540 [compost metagenome]
MGWRFFVSLAVFGLLVGLMLGRLSDVEPPRLERVEVVPDGLRLWFDDEAEVRGERVAGALVLHLAARGQAARGQLQVAGKAANWRLLAEGEKALRLELVAARPLQGSWRGAVEEGRWRLEISLRPE